MSKVFTALDLRGGVSRFVGVCFWQHAVPQQQLCPSASQQQQDPSRASPVAESFSVIMARGQESSQPRLIPSEQTVKNRTHLLKAIT